MYLGTFFLFNHLINGRNNKAKNIEKIRGTKIKDNIFNKQKTNGITMINNNVLVVLISFIVEINLV